MAQFRELEFGRELNQALGILENDAPLIDKVLQ